MAVNLLLGGAIIGFAAYVTVRKICNGEKGVNDCYSGCSDGSAGHSEKKP